MLTRDEVIRMALEAGATDYGCTVVIGHDDLLRVMNDAYAAGQAAERERILSICNEVSAEWFNYSGGAQECMRRIEEMK